MKTNLDLANTISRLVELRTINLKQASVTSNVDPYAEATPELVYSQAYRSTYEIPADRSDNINVVVELRLRAEPPDTDIETVELNASFLLTYNVTDAHSKDGAALAAFAELNGPYHVWPYWRELVSTVTGRIGLSPFFVPVLKLPVRKLDQESDTATKKSPPPKKRTQRPRKKE